MEKQAFLVAKKWVLENYRTYRRTGKMWEKYDVVDNRPKVLGLLLALFRDCLFQKMEGQVRALNPCFANGLASITNYRYTLFRQALVGLTAWSSTYS